MHLCTVIYKDGFYQPKNTFLPVASVAITWLHYCCD